MTKVKKVRRASTDLPRRHWFLLGRDGTPMFVAATMESLLRLLREKWGRLVLSADDEERMLLWAKKNGWRFARGRITVHVEEEVDL